ncbi:MAG: phage tail protein [Xenococcus sp. (in: cyanobacteria)]
MNPIPYKSESVSTYQQYLPAILQEDVFVGQFLLAFENILSGLNQTPSQEKIITAKTENPPGLEEIIDKIHLYFNPQQTPEEFLPWLAGWVALSLRDDWAVDVKRAFIQQIVGLYRKLGTKAGLIEILRIYLKNAGFGEKVEVFDRFDNFPNYFQVQLTLNDRDPDKYWRQAKIAQAIIDREKPAQTYYSLKILTPTMQLTEREQVAYPFQLFEPIANQSFVIEVQITPSHNTSQINQLAQQLVIQLQGNSKEITINSPEKNIDRDNQSFSIKYQLNYQDFADNLEGFNIKLSNRTDKDFVGNMVIKLYFKINEIDHSNTLLEQPLNLSPVLKICRLNSDQEIMEGNTIFKLANQPQTSAMRITEYFWTPPYSFQTFAAPKIQELQPDITALIEKIELEAIDEDFSLQHKYLSDRQNYYNQSLHVSGIIEGLEVEKITDKAVQIGSGSAIDSQGHLIVFKEKEGKEFSDFNKINEGELYIEYDEDDDTTSGQQNDYTRLKEDPIFGFAATTPDKGIKLATLTISGSGEIINVDLSIREYSGLSLPNSNGEALTLRSGGSANPNVAVLTGSLQIDDNLTVAGTGTSSFAGNLDVRGKIAGNLTVSGAITPSVGNSKTNGIMFPENAFGSSSGDAAWIRYYRREGGNGYATTFEIGTSNDSDDHIALMPGNGGVGIGINDPGSYKLHVNGNQYIKGDLTVHQSLKAFSNISGERAILMEAPADGDHREDGSQNATSGLVYRIETNPSTGDPIFQVRSEGQAVRLFVEHDPFGIQNQSQIFQLLNCQFPCTILVTLFPRKFTY